MKELKNGFNEMSVEEMEMVDGGSVSLLAVVGGIAAVGGMCWVCYEIGTAIGKAIGYATK